MRGQGVFDEFHERVVVERHPDVRVGDGIARNCLATGQRNRILQQRLALGLDRHHLIDETLAGIGLPLCDHERVERHL